MRLRWKPKSNSQTICRKLEKRADGIDAEIKALDTKFDEKFGGLSNRVDNHFKWLVGITVTMWAATVAAIFVSMSILLARLS